MTTSTKLELYLKNKKIYIISPHLDDSVLSAGMLLFKLKDKADITVINIFTNAHKGPYTLSAKKFLNSAGFSKAEELYKKRKIEDINALAIVKAKFLNLGLTDALFREKSKGSFLGRFLAEFNHLYPTYKFHVIKNVSVNDYVPDFLYKKLKKIVSLDSIVLAPLGIGNHVDHIISRQVCEKIFKNVIYYSDFPYNLNARSLMTSKDFQKIDFSVDLKIKLKLIMQYKSQVGMLFPNYKIPFHKEVFFIPM